MLLFVEEVAALRRCRKGLNMSSEKLSEGNGRHQGTPDDQALDTVLQRQIVRPAGLPTVDDLRCFRFVSVSDSRALCYTTNFFLASRFNSDDVQDYQRAPDVLEYGVTFSDSQTVERARQVMEEQAAAREAAAAREDVPLLRERRGDTSPLSESHARTLTDEVKRDVEEVWLKLLQLYEGEAHLALGYSSWGDDCKREFNLSRTAAYRNVHAGRVVKVLDQSQNGDWRRPNESQARELARLLGWPEKVRQVWESVSAEPNPTAEMVREAAIAAAPQLAGEPGLQPGTAAAALPPSAWEADPGARATAQRPRARTAARDDISVAKEIASLNDLLANINLANISHG